MRFFDKKAKLLIVDSGDRIQITIESDNNIRASTVLGYGASEVLARKLIRFTQDIRTRKLSENK